MPIVKNDIERADYILKKQKQLEDIRVLWHPLWTDVANFVNIQREDIDGTRQKGFEQGQTTFDGTALSALQLAADGVYGNMINPATAWFRMVFEEENLNDINEAKRWLQDVEEQLYAALQKSNFYSEARPYIEDGLSIGTANLFIEEDIVNRRIMFNSFHPRELWIGQNKYNEVDLTHRKYKITARQAIQSFCREIEKGEIIRVFDEQFYNRFNLDPFSEHEFIHTIFPREDDERDVTKIDSKNKKFASMWLYVDKKKIVRESGYDLSPEVIWRFKRTGSEVYGRSPAMDAIVEIKRLNVISKTMLKAAEMSVDGPLNVPASMQGKVKYRPGGFNYYEDGTQDKITPIQTGINYPIGIDREERIQSIIEKHFKVEFFLLLARADREMTATEIVERAGEKAMVLATMISRFSSEALTRIVDKVFEIEVKAGRIPPPPPILRDRAGGGINIVYMGPLAQAQRLAFGMQGINRSIEAVGPILNLRPEVGDNIDFDEAVREILKTQGMPAKAINSRAKRDEIRAARAEMEAKMQRQADIAQAAKTAKDLAQANKNSDGKLSEALTGGET